MQVAAGSEQLCQLSGIFSSNTCKGLRMYTKLAKHIPEMLLKLIQGEK